MFWGLILKANKKYTQTTKQAFHISHAALDVTSCADGPIQLFLTYENIKYLICTLRKNTTEQVMLDLNFNEGDEISLQSQGSGTIHISGYVTELSDPFDDLDEEESETEEQQVIATKKSKKSNDSKAIGGAKAAAGKKAEVAAQDEEDDDDDEDDSDYNGELGGAEDASDDEEEADEEDDDDDDEDEDDDDDEEDESEDEEVQQPKAKQPKLEKPKQNGVEPQKKEGKQKKEKKEAAPQQQQQAAQKQKGGEQTLAGGVKVEDIRVGNGPEAKSGKRAQVYYEGRLKTNNKVFDSLRQGAPFKFGLGRGEVIKGWDVGVVGMKVGGKRRITCPPHMAYGARGSPPTIPPNSTLVFEVELKGVQ